MVAGGGRGPALDSRGPPVDATQQYAYCLGLPLTASRGRDATLIQFGGDKEGDKGTGHGCRLVTPCLLFRCSLSLVGTRHLREYKWSDSTISAEEYVALWVNPESVQLRCP